MVSKEIAVKFADAQKIIQSIYPSLMSFYAMCEKRERSGITLRLDTRTGRCPVIEYNPEFINVVTKEVLGALISIELIRLLLHHPTARLLLPAEVCYRASNIICTRKEILNWNIAQYTQDHFPTVDDIEKEPGFNVAEDMYLERVFSILMNRINRNSKNNTKNGNPNANKSKDGNGANQNEAMPKNGMDQESSARGDKESKDANNTKQDKNADEKVDNMQKNADKAKQNGKSDEDNMNGDGDDTTDADKANGESDNAKNGKNKNKKSKQKGKDESTGGNDEDEDNDDVENDSDGDGNGDADDTENTSSDRKSNGKSNGKSKGKQSSQQAENNNHSSNSDMDHFDDMEQALDKHFSSQNMRKNTENWGENSIIDQKVINQLNREKSNLKSWGMMPADLKEMITKANCVKMDPRALLKRFARSVFSTIPFFTRRKPSKKDLKQEWIGFMQGKTYQQKAKVLFAIDSSGSMIEEQLQKAVAFVMSALKHAEVYFCWWDCKCTPFEKIRAPKPAVECTGGGGTNPQCVLDYLKSQKQRFDGIVFITDCGFSWKDPKSREHIFILRTDDAIEAPKWCKWVLSFKDIEHL